MQDTFAYKPQDAVAYVLAYNLYVRAVGRLLLAEIQDQPQDHIDAHRQRARVAHDRFLKQSDQGDGYIVPEFRRSGRFIKTTPAILMPHSANYDGIDAPTIDTIQFVHTYETPLIYGDLVKLN